MALRSVFRNFVIMYTDFFNILLEAAGYAEKDARQCYKLFNIVLRRSIEERLANSRLRFGGLFAKIDFLCHEYNVNASLSRAVNSLRHRIKGIATADAGMLRKYYKTDLEAITKFISIIYKVDIPGELSVLFPKRHKSEEHHHSVSDCIRMVVQEWDESTIKGDTDEAGAATAVVPEGWEYILKLLDKGCEINLVRPHTEERSDGKVLVPELIILYPDYLIDISTVASCFESYADTPYIALLNNLRTMPSTRAIHLGNLASQFLDEELHGRKRSYAESVTDFFHRNALSMAAATDIDESFHALAKQQRDNIHTAVGETLKQEVGHFQSSLSLIEPSFFCETLGLQGRMDMLQKDFRVLIEQKSGKGGFPMHTPDTPVYQEKHYVQMLLYMALLHYGYKIDGHDIPNSHINAFLLYSKYRHGLVKLGPAPLLTRQALMIRNQLAWCQLSYTKGGADILLKLTPESIKRKVTNDRFWTQYIRPQIEEILSPIHTASPLEKAYFLRMTQFAATEHVMAKMGNNTKENSGFSAKWHDTLADKLLAGSILYSLLITEIKKENGQVAALTLRADDTEGMNSANFRKGDIVTLYAYPVNAEPDIRRAIVHRCTIHTLMLTDNDVSVTLVLKSPQTDDEIFHERNGWRWAVEHDLYESSQTAQYRALHKFLTAPEERRKLILGTRQPLTDTSLQLNGDYGDFNELVLRAKQAKDMFLVIGPPGTGKTSFGLMNILREALTEDHSVLLMAYTNRAVDEICSKLCLDGCDSFIRIGSALSCDEAYLPFLLENRSKACRNITEIKSLIQSAKIFVGTTTAINSCSTDLFSLKTFDLAIIDEASQILEPNIIGLLAATSSPGVVSIKKFVLIGDHKQLPAVVGQSEENSRVDNPLLLDIGLTNCRNSLFERLLRRYSEHSYMLCRQGRMHPEIAEFPNISFYNGNLGIVGLPHQLDAIKERLLFISVNKPTHTSSDKVNADEAVVIAQCVKEVYDNTGDAFRANDTIGVIVPYRNQITAIREAISRYDIPELNNITIDTVERYQGSQRDVIIYGFTVQYPYQLRFLTSSTFQEDGDTIDRRLNVALTRAKKKEIIVGNASLLNQDKVFGSLIDFCKQRGCYMETPNH